MIVLLFQILPKMLLEQLKKTAQKKYNTIELLYYIFLFRCFNKLNAKFKRSLCPVTYLCYLFTCDVPLCVDAMNR